MDVRLYDQSRNVTIVPTKGPYIVGLRGVVTSGTNLYAVMRELAKGADVEASEYRCDAEFLSALKEWAASGAAAGSPSSADKENEINSGCFDGIPIIVEG